MQSVNAKLEPNSDCEQLLMSLRKALQDEHEAVATYINIENTVKRVNEEGRSTSSLSSFDMRARIMNFINHINAEEIMHEQEINDLIKFVELNCKSFPLTVEQLEDKLGEAKKDFDDIILEKSEVF
jgi:hypothetical protein